MITRKTRIKEIEREKNHAGWKDIREWVTRKLAVVTLLAVLTTLIPVVTVKTQAADWMQPYLEQAVAWGVMRGDSSGDLNADRLVTRAEFVTLINRAFGYTTLGNQPFTDVEPNDWYANDINIAYNANYFHGTTPNTASPMGLVTREQAAALLGRSLRFQGSDRLGTEFTDSTEIGTWSRGLVQEATNMGIIQGYSDGSFRPKENITRGQVACFLVRALGTLIQEPGEQTSGGVYGNLTITSPGVKLKDSVITGNLYLSGGVGLGNIELENVDVMGKIIVCGAGESQEGDHSVILRNVTADSMEIDSMTNQFMTIRAEGTTEIPQTTVRTSAYLEDLTDDNLGLQFISLDGQEDTELQLAGNIKEVSNFTPGSTLLVAQGVSKKVTVDEKAVGSTLSVDPSASILDLNLDIGVPVNGTGSVDHMTINAPGANVTMLPDTITVRPGVNANVYGQKMDSVAAAESSDDPRILTGYPIVKNATSRTADAVFSTNKPGTIHWALTALTDGSVGEEALMNPLSYTNKILLSGTLNATSSKTEFTSRLTGLTVDGSYYVSAILVDNRGRRSPVKVAAFTTPDDTVPAFATGYPYTILTNNALTAGATENIEQVIQAMVMPTKDCQLYYALLPKGSTAPTAQALKTAAVTGNLGYGRVDIRKNTPYLVPRINSSYIQEQTTYDLYLWLSDADNGKSSAVKKLSVTTKDLTPPVVTSMYQSNSAARTITMTYTMSEAATLYWAVVPEGDTLLRPAIAGEEVNLNDLAAKVQVESGSYATKRGTSNAARAGTEYHFTISGLEEQTSYDLYYIAKDRAGNYADAVQVLKGIKTLDGTAPTVELQFSETQTDASGRTNPLTETDVTLSFSETVWGVYTDKGVRLYDQFTELYAAVEAAEGDATAQRAAKAELGDALRKYIAFYTLSSAGRKELAADPASPDAANRPTDENEWVIDYREAIITRDNKKMNITFPSGTGIHLASGGRYQFELQNICDTTGNVMSATTLGPFQTIFATVELTVGDTVRIPIGNVEGGYSDLAITDDGNLRVDMSFHMIPRSTSRVANDTVWDMLIWTDTTMDFTVFRRPVNGPNNTRWERVGSDVSANVSNAAGQGGKVYASLTRYIQGQDLFDPLNEQEEEMEYAIHVNAINGDRDFTAWNQNVNMGVTVIAGGNYPVGLAGLNSLGFQSHLSSALTAGAVSIGQPDPFEVMIPFTDSKAPNFKGNSPEIEAGDVSATINVMIDRPGTVYYVIAPLQNQNVATSALLTEKRDGDRPELYEIPTSGLTGTRLELSLPLVTEITRGVQGAAGVISGNTGQKEANISIPIQLDDLQAETTYLVYLATSGVSPVYSDYVLCYQFTTAPVEKPKMELNMTGGGNVTVRTDRNASVRGILIVDGSLSILNRPFSDAAGTAINYTNPTNNNYTVLNALIDNYGTSARGEVLGSIFDQFATESLKQELEQTIQNASITPNTIIDTIQSFNVTGNTATAVRKFNNMEPDRWYCFLGYAESPLGSAKSFRAVRPLEVTDEEWPKVQDAVVSFERQRDGTYDATLTLTFTENLSFRDIAGGSQQIVSVTPTGPGAYSSSEYVSVTMLPDGPLPTGWNVYTATGNPTTTRVIAFTRTRVQANEYTFAIKRGLCDKWDNRPPTSSFQATLTITGNDTDGYQYSVKIPSEWDARNTRSTTRNR